MSSVARWAYTAKATVWPILGRGDWNGVATYGPPEVFDCAYAAKSIRMTDAKGVEFTTRQVIYTEREGIKQDDMVLIGESVDPSPIAAGAFGVRTVQRDQDLFEGVADDFTIWT